MNEQSTPQAVPSRRDSHAYDVFISYSNKDRQWVDTALLARLEAAGLKVLIDYRDFEIGKSTLENIEQAVDTSRHTLLVLSPHWLESEWGSLESLLTGTADPAARRRRLIPLMLQSCTPPARIAMLTYADFTRADRREIEIERLIKSLARKPSAGGAGAK